MHFESSFGGNRQAANTLALEGRRRPKYGIMVSLKI